MHEQNPVRYVLNLIAVAKAKIDLGKLYNIEEKSFELTGEMNKDKLSIPEDASLEEIREIATQWNKNQSHRLLQQQELLRKVIDMAKKWGL